MSASLAIVLPVHNQESQLAQQVDAVLELASELTSDFSVLIVDDGSTDDTYETAGDLAARYPQISVMRLAVRRGLGPAIDAIRQRVTADVVIVHDGVTPLDTAEVHRLWQERTGNERPTKPATRNQPESIRDLAGISTLNDAMTTAHQRISGFQVIASLLREGGTDGTVPLERTDTSAADSQTPTPHVGTIPPLPTPKVRDVITHFALGE